MPIAQETILAQVLIAVRLLGDDLDNEALRAATFETPLIGRHSDVDSITLVNLIVDVEEHLATELDLEVILADERAMSQRRSPFRTIQSLADYIFELQRTQQQA